MAAQPQYVRQQIRRPGRLSHGVLGIIILCSVVFLFLAIGRRFGWISRDLGSGIVGILALSAPALEQGRLWQIATHVFLHLDLMHILFNMFILGMFGPRVEESPVQRPS